MHALAEQFERLGLSEYLKRFIAEGFDTWETVLDITESDLNILDVKLGHRRKIQRAIAESRGQPIERPLILEHGKVALGEPGYHSDESATESKEPSGPATPVVQSGAPISGTKRKYRRHPKADKHAPERPPSAYVIFSNQVRDELKGRDLTFTEIAKLVGERWQVLDPAVRETCEKQASAAKESYYAQMAEYKKTPQYQEYQQYLAEFKSKHSNPRSEGKRSKLQTESSRESPNRSTSIERRGPSSASISEAPTIAHYRTHSNSGGGLSSLGQYRPQSASISPAQFSIGLVSPITRNAYSPRSSPPVTASANTGSYDLPHHSRTPDVADSRVRDHVYSAPVASSRQWQRSLEEGAGQTSYISDYMARRPERLPGSLPPALIHQDTSRSSHSDSLPPPTPYQSNLLPPLDAAKADRFLPHPIPSITGTGVVASPLDMRSNQTSPISAQLQNQQLDNSGFQFHALLRASELARDADMQDEAAKRHHLSR